MTRLRLRVFPKPGIRDPQSEAVGESLQRSGFSGFAVQSVGRTLDLEFPESNESEARQALEAMCDKMLVNPNVEAFAIDVVEGD